MTLLPDKNAKISNNYPLSPTLLHFFYLFVENFLWFSLTICTHPFFFISAHEGK